MQLLWLVKPKSFSAVTREGQMARRVEVVRDLKTDSDSDAEKQR